MLDDLEAKRLDAHAAALVVRMAASRSGGGPRLVMLAGVPPGDDEVAVLPDDGAQEFEACEAFGPVDGPFAGGEAAFDLGTRVLGDRQSVDIDEGQGGSSHDRWIGADTTSVLRSRLTTA